MNPSLKKFGKNLKELRVRQGLTLRKISSLTDYDPSNWSKIERGLISPPSDHVVLRKWAKILKIKESKAIESFVDEANIAQGIIPFDIVSEKNAAACLPAFFRTLRNKKPSKDEIDKLIELVRNS